MEVFSRLEANQEVLAPTSLSGHKSNYLKKDYICYCKLISYNLHYKRMRGRSKVMRKEVQVRVMEV
jgi:hypothetical protein